MSYPQKWNKYAYVQNNPLANIDPDGLDDYKVFLSAPEARAGNWAAAAATAQRNGHTLTVYSGAQASVGAYNAALSDPASRVVFVGHTQYDPNHTANAVVLGNGTSMGTTSTSQTLDTTTDPPTLGAQALERTTINANSVALFGCDSLSLNGQYNVPLFAGMDSGADKVSSLEAMAPAAAAWVAADSTARPAPGTAPNVVGPVSSQGSANAVFSTNRRKNDRVDDRDGDRLVEKRR